MGVLGGKSTDKIFLWDQLTAISFRQWLWWISHFHSKMRAICRQPKSGLQIPQYSIRQRQHASCFIHQTQLLRSVGRATDHIYTQQQQQQQQQPPHPFSPVLISMHIHENSCCNFLRCEFFPTSWEKVSAKFHTYFHLWASGFLISTRRAHLFSRFFAHKTQNKILFEIYNVHATPPKRSLSITFRVFGTVKVVFTHEQANLIVMYMARVEKERKRGGGGVGEGKVWIFPLNFNIMSF